MYVLLNDSDIIYLCHCGECCLWYYCSNISTLAGTVDQGAVQIVVLLFAFASANAANSTH